MSEQERSELREALGPLGPIPIQGDGLRFQHLTPDQAREAIANARETLKADVEALEAAAVLNGEARDHRARTDLSHCVKGGKAAAARRAELIRRGKELEAEEQAERQQ